MQRASLRKLRKTVETLWARTGLDGRADIFDARRDDGSAHVEIVAGRYDIVVTERGQETERIAGLSLEEAAGWFLFGMASAHGQVAEIKGRQAPRDAPPLPCGLVDDGYSRWNWMAPTIAILNRISAEHGEMALRDYREVLSRHPLSAAEIRNARYPLLPGIEAAEGMKPAPDAS